MNGAICISILNHMSPLNGVIFTRLTDDDGLKATERKSPYHRKVYFIQLIFLKNQSDFDRFNFHFVSHEL
jgi:hypothetical protein